MKSLNSRVFVPALIPSLILVCALQTAAQTSSATAQPVRVVNTTKGFQLLRKAAVLSLGAEDRRLRFRTRPRSLRLLGSSSSQVLAESAGLMASRRSDKD
jgi:hypothetical protein